MYIVRMSVCVVCTCIIWPVSVLLFHPSIFFFFYSYKNATTSNYYNFFFFRLLKIIQRIQHIVMNIVVWCMYANIDEESYVVWCYVCSYMLYTPCSHRVARVPYYTLSYQIKSSSLGEVTKNNVATWVRTRDIPQTDLGRVRGI